MPLIDLMETLPALIPPAEDPAPVQLEIRVPQRLQRSRKRGARTPAGAVYVGRPTMFANPFASDRFGHARSILLYGDWLEGRLSDLELERRGFCPAEIDALHRHRGRVVRNFPMIARKDLVCWCPLSSKWCHADLLMRHANEDIPPAAFFTAMPSPFAQRGRLNS
jgi:hypothetical protein